MSSPQADSSPPILKLGDAFYDQVSPADFPAAIERFVNRRWAQRVGLGDIDWEKHFARFEPLAGNLPAPLALRYHGHQFRVYNPDIGDGRGFLFAQLRDDRGRLLDLGTKGSGQTPYSRQGDGRLTLKGGVREVLATEMLEALGVNTSKSFALFETGESLWRGDEPSPTRSSVLTRLNHGHVRIGSFQRLAFFNDAANIAKLTRYCLRHLLDLPVGDDADNATRLLDHVCATTAQLAASYIAAGFVHGVLNSDNINITGESFDYGPWRFAPEWDEQFTAAYFDHGGLYAFGRQPEAIHWDVAQLAGCLALIGEAPALSDLLGQWPARFEAALVERMLGRLGIAPSDDASDRVLLSAMLTALRSRMVGIDRFFFDWRAGRMPEAEHYSAPPFDTLRTILKGRERLQLHSYWTDPAPCSMLIEEVESIWAAIAEHDDWAPFETKIRAVRRMGDAMTADGAA
ncbi:protein adenylyltransferase SelO family protein [Sphingomonas xanthus]|uniref:YdiU family protein n=1 Tax=Sphingomonas xanthus TaxID=2594473 RepID=A0A516ISW8_9SPHN|nr:YdiU family protein [Sphingomonas xanthus]QDP20001.1 YdiU family protein [Sphingomonas xanthus]